MTHVRATNSPAEKRRLTWIKRTLASVQRKEAIASRTYRKIAIQNHERRRRTKSSVPTSKYFAPHTRGCSSSVSAPRTALFASIRRER